MGDCQPYKVAGPFDHDSLPAALRRDHATKEGVWGIIRLLKGKLLLSFAGTAEAELLEAGRPGLIAPQRVHSVELLGPMQMVIEFYAERPAL